MAAGYAVNSLDQGVGYPMRMTYILFPMVYYWVTRAFNETRLVWIVVFCMLCLCIGLLGLSMDPGHQNVTILNIFEDFMSADK